MLCSQITTISSSKGWSPLTSLGLFSSPVSRGPLVLLTASGRGRLELSQPGARMERIFDGLMKTLRPTALGHVSAVASLPSWIPS